jgi:hypothetical protein
MKMKLALAAIAGCAALCLALPALGQNDPTVYFNGNTSGAVYGGVDAGLYGGTVGGVAGVDGAIVCDDFVDHISGGQSWSATEFSMASLASSVSGTFFPSIGVLGYAELAYLAYTMFSLSPTDLTDQANISGAMWYIAEGQPPLTTGAQNYITAAQNAVSAAGGASAYLNSAALDNLFLLTPSGTTAGAQGAPQEMWYESVPEGGAALLYLLLAGMVCFGAMRFSSRSESLGTV